MGFVAGPYTATFNSVTLGQLELDSLKVTFTNGQDDITGDNFGEAIQDGVYRGGNCYLDMMCLEYDSLITALAGHPYIATPGIVGTLGSLISAASMKTLVLTKLYSSGTTVSPATLTSTAAAIPRGFPLEYLMAPKLKRVPLRLQLYPYIASSVKYFYQVT